RGERSEPLFPESIMIGRLRGLVAEIGEEDALIDVSGVGYVVRCGSRTLSHLPALGEEAVLHVETQWSEALGIKLYGFLGRDERRRRRPDGPGRRRAPGPPRGRAGPAAPGRRRRSPRPDQGRPAGAGTVRGKWGHTPISTPLGGQGRGVQVGNRCVSPLSRE